MKKSLWSGSPNIEKNLKIVKKIMKENLNLPSEELRKKIESYIDAPGKYLRAGMVLSLGELTDGEILKGRLYLAASVEVLHLATLIHDDVIDGANLRRGVCTLQTAYSNKITIYAGDYLMAYSIRLLLKGLKLLDKKKAEKMPTNLDLLVIEKILSGELTQLVNQNDSKITMKEYIKQIRNKTATLFAYSAQLGVYSPNKKRLTMYKAYKFGISFGIAFQLLDDLYDFTKISVHTGKPRYQDLKNGIYTAPMIFLREENSSVIQMLNNINQSKSDENLTSLLGELKKSNAINKTKMLINEYKQKALTTYRELDFPLQDSSILKVIDKLFVE